MPKFNSGIIPETTILRISDKVLERNFVPVNVQFYHDETPVGKQLTIHWPDELALHQVVEKLYGIVSPALPPIDRAVADVVFDGSFYSYLMQDGKAVDDPKDIPEE